MEIQFLNGGMTLLNMIKLKNLLNENRGTKSVDYGCLMCYISEKDTKKILKLNNDFIADDILYKEGNEFGRETECHITAKYGFSPDLTKTEIKTLIEDISQFKAKLKSISQFKNKEKGFDVVKYDVESDIIKKLNKAACKFPNEDSHPKYHPHLTLAYVKPDSFDEKDTVVDMEVTIDKIVYSPIKGDKMYFELPEETINENSKYEYPLAKKDELHSYEGQEGWKGKIVWMSPDKFLSLASPMPPGNERIEYRIKNRLPLDFCVLEVDMKHKKVTGHEGRHRATISKKLGIDKIPVLIFTGSNFERVPKWNKETHDEIDAAEFKPQLDESKLSTIKEKRVLFLTSEITKIEREVDRLDSMGGMEGKIQALNIKLQQYQYELSGWNNYNTLNEYASYKDIQCFFT